MVSIILPVYNGEAHLEQCIRSVLAQTIEDIQLILINDGSVDGTAGICDRYAAEDRRVMVIHQENAGVSAARNEGLQAATGEYIGFVDADDWIDVDYLQHMVATAGDADADMVVSGFVSDNKYTKPIKYKKQRVLNTISQKVSGSYALTDSYVWRYLFSVKFIKKHK